MQKQTRVRALVSQEANSALKMIALEKRITVTELLKQGVICWSKKNLNENSTSIRFTPKEIESLLYPKGEK